MHSPPSLLMAYQTPWFCVPHTAYVGPRLWRLGQSLLDLANVCLQGVLEAVAHERAVSGLVAADVGGFERIEIGGPMVGSITMVVFFCLRESRRQ